MIFGTMSVMLLNVFENASPNLIPVSMANVFKLGLLPQASCLLVPAGKHCSLWHYREIDACCIGKVAFDSRDFQVSCASGSDGVMVTPLSDRTH